MSVNEGAIQLTQILGAPDPLRQQRIEWNEGNCGQDQRTSNSAPEYAYAEGALCQFAGSLGHNAIHNAAQVGQE